MEATNSNNEMETFLEDFEKAFALPDFDTDAIIQVYDKISEHHAKFMPAISMGVHQMLTDRVFKYVKQVDVEMDKDCSVLDICCGSGIMGKCLRKSGFTGRLEGIDGSKGMLSQAVKLENVYDELHHEVVKLDSVKSLKSRKYDILTVGHAFFPDCLHAEHIDVFLELLRPGGLLAFGLNYDKVKEKTQAMKHLETGAIHLRLHIEKIDAKIAQLIQNGVFERVFECDVDGVYPRLSNLCPYGNSEFVHERHICIKKL